MDLASLDYNYDTHKDVEKFRTDAANSSPGLIAQNYNQDIPKAQGLIKSDERFNEGLGGADKAMLQAVQNKYKSQFAGDFSRIAQKNEMQAQGDQLRKLETATELANQELQMNMQKQALKYKMKQAKKAARGQLLGAVLGIAGAGVGAMYGGPQGAMAGGQLGQGVGQAAGSR